MSWTYSRWEVADACQSIGFLQPSIQSICPSLLFQNNASYIQLWINVNKKTQKFLFLTVIKKSLSSWSSLMTLYILMMCTILADKLLLWNCELTRVHSCVKVMGWVCSFKLHKIISSENLLRWQRYQQPITLERPRKYFSTRDVRDFHCKRLTW